MQLFAVLPCAFLLVMGPCAVGAQSSQQTDTKAPNQFLSHQMHQPPANEEKAPALSQERLEEIRQLYELAKKEKSAGIQSDTNAGNVK